MSIALHTSLPSRPNIKQIDCIQVLRAFAVVQIAWAHSGIGLQGTTLPSFGIFGVDIFFVISGFIMASIVSNIKGEHGAEASWHFLKRRLIRIFPIYWIVCALVLLREIKAHGFHLSQFIPNFFLLPYLDYPRFVFILGLSWTLIFEMFFYFLISAVLLIKVRNALPIVILILCGLVAVGLYAGCPPPTLTIICNPMLLEFVSGVAIGLLYKRMKSNRAAGVAMVSAGAVFAILLQILSPPVASSLQMVLAEDHVFGRVATWGVAAALIVAGAVLWSPQIKSRVGLTAVIIGNASYSIYLLSPLVEEFALRTMSRLHPPHVVAQVCSVLAIAGIGWLCYQFVEWPLVRKLQTRFN